MGAGAVDVLKGAVVVDEDIGHVARAAAENSPPDRSPRSAGRTGSGSAAETAPPSGGSPPPSRCLSPLPPGATAADPRSAAQGAGAGRPPCLYLREKYTRRVAPAAADRFGGGTEGSVREGGVTPLTEGPVGVPVPCSLAPHSSGSPHLRASSGDRPGEVSLVPTVGAHGDGFRSWRRPSDGSGAAMGENSGGALPKRAQPVGRQLPMEANLCIFMRRGGVKSAHNAAGLGEERETDLRDLSAPPPPAAWWDHGA